MPTARETPRQLLAHCPDARCRGSAQSAVEGVEVITEWTYQEAASGPVTRRGVERSVTHFRFKNEEDRICKVCGKRSRELTDQVRPKYENLSGVRQDGLLNVESWSPGGRDAAIEAKLAELAEKIGNG